jgi:TRAP-type C4-dicarboxylate transport system substrate-binding protein
VFAVDEIYKRSNGRLKIEIFPAFSLGLNPRTWLRDMRDGSIDISLLFSLYVGGEEPSYTITEMPDIWQSREQQLLAADALFNFRKKVLKEVWNSELIATGTIAARNYEINTRAKQIRTLNDLKGLKIRIHSARLEGIMRRLGAAPQFMPLGDVYMAAKSGTIDGALTGAIAIHSTKLNEVFKYAVELTYEGGIQDIVVSNKAWDPLPDDLKQIVRDVFSLYSLASKARAVQAEQDDSYWKRRNEKDAGMIYNRLSEGDYDKMRKVAMEEFLEWIKTTGGRTLEAWALIRPILIPHTEPGIAENYFEEYKKTIERGY